MDRQCTLWQVSAVSHKDRPYQEDLTRRVARVQRKETDERFDVKKGSFAQSLMQAMRLS